MSMQIVIIISDPSYRTVFEPFMPETNCMYKIKQGRVGQAIGELLLPVEY